MTLVHAGYFAEVVGRLRADGHDVRHFALLAERATVQEGVIVGSGVRASELSL
jgi:hypothetical protein